MGEFARTALKRPFVEVRSWPTGDGRLSELLAPKSAIQDVALNVSKVASKSSAGAPALGHYEKTSVMTRLWTASAQNTT